MGALAVPHYTPEQYLELERKAEYKSEYIDGQILAMAGASEEHAVITLNIGGELRSRLKGRSCRVHSPDLRVRVASTGLYTYPDVVVVCGKRQLTDDKVDTLLNPTVIFEVLSPSTESWDRGGKFAHYRRIESLSDYILVSQDKPSVEHYVRQPNGDWLLHVVEGLDAEITIASLDCHLPLAEIYYDIEFDAAAPTDSVRP